MSMMLHHTVHIAFVLPLVLKGEMGLARYFVMTAVVHAAHSAHAVDRKIKNKQNSRQVPCSVPIHFYNYSSLAVLLGC